MIKNILEDELIIINQKLEEKLHQISNGINEVELDNIKFMINNCLDLVRQMYGGFNMSNMIQDRLSDKTKDKIEERTKEKGFVKPSGSFNISSYIRSLIVMTLDC